MKTAFFSVDRFEGNVAVLVSDAGESVEMPRFELPKGVREGSVLRVPFGAHSRPNWSGAELDKAEEERRPKEAQRTLDELKRIDPGRDIALYRP